MNHLGIYKVRDCDSYVLHSKVFGLDSISGWRHFVDVDSKLSSVLGLLKTDSIYWYSNLESFFKGEGVEQLLLPGGYI